VLLLSFSYVTFYYGPEEWTAGVQNIIYVTMVWGILNSIIASTITISHYIFPTQLNNRKRFLPAISMILGSILFAIAFFGLLEFISFTNEIQGAPDIIIPNALRRLEGIGFIISLYFGFGFVFFCGLGIGTLVIWDSEEHIQHVLRLLGLSLAVYGFVLGLFVFYQGIPELGLLLADVMIPIGFVFLSIWMFAFGYRLLKPESKNHLD